MLVVKRFTADWCGPCRMLAPIMNSISSEFPGVTFETINVDNDEVQASQYDVSSIPLVVLIKDGNEVQRFIGVKPKQSYVQSINEYK